MRRHSNARHVSRAEGLNKSEVGCVELDDGSKFELADKFCYLDDILWAGGGAIAGAVAGAEAGRGARRHTHYTHLRTIFRPKIA